MFRTWKELTSHHCSRRSISSSYRSEMNPYYEDFAQRRYNYSPNDDFDACRLVFLKGVLENPTNKTLVRNGRFIWCRNLTYVGLSSAGLRQIEFTVDKGNKVFRVSENNVLCIPSAGYVNNNRYFRTAEKTFLPFSSVFKYENTLKMLARNANITVDEMKQITIQDNPYKPGTLISPRMGYFYPDQVAHQKERPIVLEEEHPCGLILGPSFIDNYLGRELYRVRFGNHTHEKIHPVQMEIIK